MLYSNNFRLYTKILDTFLMFLCRMIDYDMFHFLIWKHQLSPAPFTYIDFCTMYAVAYLKKFKKKEKRSKTTTFSSKGVHLYLGPLILKFPIIKILGFICGFKSNRFYGIGCYCVWYLYSSFCHLDPLFASIH